jgi:hypothetical protein
MDDEERHAPTKIGSLVQVMPGARIVITVEAMLVALGRFESPAE